jgi:hypothetical protein
LSADPDSPIAKPCKADDEIDCRTLGHLLAPLAVGYSHETKKGEANVWVHQYGKARVFGTTMGHYNHTMSDPVYLDLITRGTLWATGKLQEDGSPVAGYGPAK